MINKEVLSMSVHSEVVILFGIVTFISIMIFSPNIMSNFVEAQGEGLSNGHQGSDSFSAISRGSDSGPMSLLKTPVAYMGNSIEPDYTQVPQQTSNQTASTGSESFSEISRGEDEGAGEENNGENLPLLP